MEIVIILINHGLRKTVLYNKFNDGDYKSGKDKIEERVRPNVVLVAVWVYSAEI